MLSTHGIPCARLVGAPGLLQNPSTPTVEGDTFLKIPNSGAFGTAGLQQSPPLGLTEGVAAMAAALPCS